MHYFIPALIALSLVPLGAHAEASSVFSLTPEAVYQDAASFEATPFENLNGERGFVWLAPRDLSFDQMCLYMGAQGSPISVHGASVSIYGRGTNAFPTGGVNAFIASSTPTDFVVAPVSDSDTHPTEMQPYCFSFAQAITVVGEETYVFAINLNSKDPTGYYLSGAGYPSYAVTKQAYTGNVSDTSFWAGLAIPFELRHEGVPPEETESRSNVLFLPGLQGSRLYEDVLGVPNRRWELSVGMSGQDAQALLLDREGAGVRDLYTKEGEVVARADLPLGDFDVYRSFLGQLAGLKEAGTIADYLAFPYDWRMDPVAIVENGTRYDTGTRFLAQELEALAQTSATGRVTVVGHSNGGLVAKALMRKLEREGKAHLVDLVVFVAVPHLGTPRALLPMLHGDYGALTSFGGLYLAKPQARELAERMPDGYALLPSPSYFKQAFGDLVNVSRAPSLFARWGMGNDQVRSYLDLERFLTGSGGRTEPTATDTEEPNVLSAALLAGAKATHSLLDAWMPPPGVRVVQVVGVGLDTLQGVAYREQQERECDLLIFSCRDVVKLRHEPNLTTEGDGTVVAGSAKAGGWETYAIDLHQANVELGKNWRHADIMESVPFQELFSGLIKGETSALARGAAADRLRLKVLSPVALHLYDEAGRHTGMVPNPGSDLLLKEEAIPNSYYEEFGEGKYAGLPADGKVRVTLTGLAPGTFTYEIASLTGTGTRTVTYEDLPVTASTSASMLVTDGDLEGAALALDVDSDGNTDATLAPGETPNAPMYLTLMRASLGAMSLRPGTLRQLSAKLTNIEHLLLGDGLWEDADDDGDRNDSRKGEQVKKRLLRKLAKIEAWIVRALASGTIPKDEAQAFLAMFDQLKQRL